jgi:hypothetical protein
MHFMPVNCTCFRNADRSPAWRRRPSAEAGDPYPDTHQRPTVADAARQLVSPDTSFSRRHGLGSLTGTRNLADGSGSVEQPPSPQSGEATVHTTAAGPPARQPTERDQRDCSQNGGGAAPSRPLAAASVRPPARPPATGWCRRRRRARHIA